MGKRGRSSKISGGARARSDKGGLGMKLLVLGASLLFALLAAEGGLRLFGIAPERFTPPRWLTWHEGAFRNLGIWGNGYLKRPSPFESQGVSMGEYVPGAMFKIQYDTNPRGYFDEDNAVLMTVNSLGMRGRAWEYSVEKPAGAYRILGLGDSFTFGVGVRDEDIFMRRLEGGLNSAAAGEKRFEVLNAAVGGYNTRDEVLYLKEKWLPMGLDPDLVLVVFYLNDAYSDTTFLNMGQAQGIYLEQPGGLAKYSRLWDLAQHKYRVRKVTRDTEAYYQKHFFSDAANSLGQPNDRSMDWNISRNALQRLSEFAVADGFKAGVVIFPELHELGPDYPFAQIHELVRASCESFGLPVLDLRETFAGSDAAKLWVHPSDHHPNEEAHAMAAKAIEEFVKREFLGGSRE